MKQLHVRPKTRASLVPRLRSWWRALPLALLGACTSADDMNTRREALIAEIEADVRLTAHELGFSRLEPAVIAALRSVPRQAFVPEGLQDLAYGNHPLPIGEGQTISQPYIVAVMTELLDRQPGRPGARGGHRVRLPGGGAGRPGEAGVHHRDRRRSWPNAPARPAPRAGLHQRDGARRGRLRGWPEHAPFDGIIVTAAPDHVPQPLVEQLKPGGRLVIPVGPPDGVQQLVVYEKEPSGELVGRHHLPVRFVPVTGVHGR